MSDMGDDFRAWREAGKAKRESNRSSSAKMLAANGINFKEKNFGAHLIVRHNGMVIDFWPGTGRWQKLGGRAVVRSRSYRYGVRNLIAEVQR